MASEVVDEAIALIDSKDPDEPVAAIVEDGTADGAELKANDIEVCTSSAATEPNQRVAKEGGVNRVFQKIVDEELQKEKPDFDKISMYLEFNVNLRYIDDSQATVLHRATYAGVTHLAALALKQKVDVNAVNNVGRTALHCAAETNSPEAVRLFLDARANVNITSLGGMTALHLAVRSKTVEVIKILLDHNETDLDIENNLRQTPAMICKDSAILKMIEKSADQRMATQ